jgi:pSer/pThr/pTyr-binding forkhead associated (FHA) protein
LTTGKDIAMHVRLVVIGGKNQGREIPVTKPQFLIGRGEGCQLQPASDRVSRKHCVLLVEKDRVLLRDLKSTNFTFVNHEQVAGDQELKSGDHIDVAGVLEFEILISADAAEKKKTKIHSIQEAAVRTVKAAASEDLDISGWLDGESIAEPPKPAADPSLENTRAEQRLSDTTTILTPHKTQEEKKDDKKKSGKHAGHFEQKKKPIGETSQEAADDALRHFFGRKRT